MMKAFIVDDEKYLVKTMLLLLKRIGDVEVVGTASSVKEAVEKIPQSNPDILFLDVELQDGLSFNILSQLNYKNYHIVFITAHSHYAIEAIHFSAFDYLLKPISIKDLEETLQRLKNETKDSLEERIKVLENNIKNLSDKKEDTETKVVLKTDKKYVIVKPEEIICISADNSYSTVHIKGNEKITVSKNIKTFEEMFTNKNFFRTHRSHLINISEIREYVKLDGGYLVMSNNMQVPISTEKVKQLLKKLHQ